jgi:hypothetical protein
VSALVNGKSFAGRALHFLAVCGDPASLLPGRRK